MKKKTIKIKKNRSYISFNGGVIYAVRTGGTIFKTGFVFLMRNNKQGFQEQGKFSLPLPYHSTEKELLSVTCSGDLNEETVLGFTESVSCGICVMTKYFVRVPTFFLSHYFPVQTMTEKVQSTSYFYK